MGNAGDQEVSAYICSMFCIDSPTRLQYRDKKCRDNALHKLKQSGIPIRQIERLTGINRGIITRA